MAIRSIVRCVWRENFHINTKIGNICRLLPPVGIPSAGRIAFPMCGNVSHAQRWPELAVTKRIIKTAAAHAREKAMHLNYSLTDAKGGKKPHHHRTVECLWSALLPVAGWIRMKYRYIQIKEGTKKHITPRKRHSGFHSLFLLVLPYRTMPVSERLAALYRYLVCRRFPPVEGASFRTCTNLPRARG